MYRGPVGGDRPAPPDPPRETRRRAPISSPYARSQERQITASAVALKGTTYEEGDVEDASPARPIGSGVSQADHAAPIVNKQPVSVLKRISYEEEIDAPAVRTNWHRAMDAIPHNPLR